MELNAQCGTLERARNAAIQWLESFAVRFGPQHKSVIGRLGVLAGKEVDVRATEHPGWRLRLDNDPQKGPHFNGEVNTGLKRDKAVFRLPGDEAAITRQVRRRAEHRALLARLAVNDTKTITLSLQK